jgi:1,2-diacylglycerol 3-alpha-glucosyltransferase
MPDASPAATQNLPQPLKVFLVCTSLGHGRRGVESLFRETFDALHGFSGLEVQLFKGGGESATDEYRLWCLRKTNWPARLVGKLFGRSSYVIEQLTFLPTFIRQIRKRRPHVILYSDVNLAMRLGRWRRWIGVPYRLLYSNGAPALPPFIGTDHVQHLTPPLYQAAIDAGEPPWKHTLLPLGMRVPPGSPRFDAAERRRLRQQLNLPTDRPIVLSVGWISSELKRMDYLIDEIPSLPQPRPFLVLLGEIDDESPPIIARAKEKLGEGNYAIRSAPYEEVGRYYQAADVFALASVNEAFGRVYLEALIHGLPCAVHDSPGTRFVLGDHASYADLTQPGELARTIQQLLPIPLTTEVMAARREYVRRTFSWEMLCPAYRDLFIRCYQHPDFPLF